MKTILPIYKFPGETPLECIKRFRVAFPEYKNISMTYAGRLDPMAEGLLLILAGNEVHEKDKWLHKDKTYLVDILFGISTDSYDILGKIHKHSVQKVDLEKLPLILKNHLGKLEQKFPPYSSFKIHGKALFKWAQEGRLNEITIPSKTREIFSIELLNKFTKSSKDLLTDIKSRVQQVHGDFRQDETLNNWQTILKENHDWQLVTIRVHCSSGTYMRSLANTIGHELGNHAIAYSIKRESVGEFMLK